MTIMNQKPGSKKHPVHDKPKKQAPAPLTPEQQAAYVADQAKRIEDAKAREAALVLYEKRVKGMSDRQLLTELRKREKHPEDFLLGGMASILGIVLSNTKTPENPFRRLGAYLV
jgi:hypothetical protein